MLEEGIEITFIKEFFGHNDLKTTLRYTHVSNKSLQKIRNPFDNITFSSNIVKMLIKIYQHRFSKVDKRMVFIHLKKNEYCK